MGSASGTGIIATAVTPVGTGCQHAAGSSGSCSCCSPCSCQGTCHQKPHVPTTSTLLAGRGRSSERQRPFKGLLLPFPPSKVQMGVKGLKRTQPPCGWDVFSKDGPISVPGQKGSGTSTTFDRIRIDYEEPHQKTSRSTSPSPDLRSQFPSVSLLLLLLLFLFLTSGIKAAGAFCPLSAKSPSYSVRVSVHLLTCYSWGGRGRGACSLQ